MKKRPMYITEWRSDREDNREDDREDGREDDREDNREPDQKFIENFQTAILLSLLEEGQLARWQFDFCVKELEKTRKYQEGEGYA